MKKNTLLLLVATVAILTMGAGCVKQIANNPTGAVVTTPSSTKKVTAKGINEYLQDPLGPDTYYSMSPITSADMHLKQPQQVKVFSLGFDKCVLAEEFCTPKNIEDGTYLVTISLLSDAGWSDGKVHEFYYEYFAAERGSLYYGPFKDNVLKLKQEASKKDNNIMVVIDSPIDISSAYKYDIKTGNLTSIKDNKVVYNFTGQPNKYNGRPAVYIMGIDGSKLILWQTIGGDNSPGPNCEHEIWTTNGLSYLDLNNLSQGPKPYVVPEAKKQAEKKLLE